MLLNFVTASTEQINAILRNNVSTLKLLYLENFQIRASYISFNIPVLPITDLRLHGCPIKEIVPILRKCPQVTSLFVGGFNIDTVVAQCIALHSKQLKKLTLKNLLNVGAGVLLLIAQGCPEIQLLILMDCSIGNDIGEVVRILSKLQKLVLGSTLDIAELHTIESQSLRAVELVCRSLSVPKFQQFSQGCPNLAVLILNNIDFVEGEDVSSVLKNCPNLQYLQMTGVSGDMQNEVLKSAAMYCPILRTLNVSDSDDCAPEAIDHVLRSCIHIHNLMLIDAEENCAENGGYRIADPVISARVAVTRETPLCLGSLNHPSNKF